MNESEIRRTFFYAMQEAGLYDATIEWVAPYYKAMHKMMLRLALECVRANSSAKAPALVLDIGCGTGTEAIRLLRSLPHVKLVGLDLCAPMNDLFVKNAAKAKVSPERYRLVVGDVLDKTVEKKIRTEGESLLGTSRFQLIISAFTMHHLTTEEKKTAFALVHSLLGKDGVFLLGDLFNYGGESDWLTNRIFNWETAWIAANFEKAVKKTTNKSRASVELKNKWLDHYLKENRLDSVTTQLNLLEQVGFSEAGNPFRYWQVGLLWARK